MVNNGSGRKIKKIVNIFFLISQLQNIMFKNDNSNNILKKNAYWSLKENKNDFNVIINSYLYFV